MNTNNNDQFLIEELESRFEMEVVSPVTASPDSSTCSSTCTR